MDVDMRHDLRGTRAVVLQQVEAVTRQLLKQSGRYALHGLAHCVKRCGRQVGEVCGMVFADHQGVSLFKGGDIQKSKCVLVFVDRVGRHLSGNDFTENAVGVCHGHSPYDGGQWWAQQGSNLRPKDYESSALTD